MPSLRTRQAYDRTALATVDASVDAAQAAAAAAQAAVDALAGEVPPSGIRTITANGTLAPNDVSVLVDSTAGNITLGLSNASGFSVPVVITKTVAANSVDIVPTTPDTLNGGAGPVTLTLSGESKTFVGDQVSQWFG